MNLPTPRKHVGGKYELTERPRYPKSSGVFCFWSRPGKVIMKYVLDTTIFNRILDGRFSLATLPYASGFVATKIQLSELKATNDLDRRAKLLSTFSDVAPEIEHASFSFDTPGAGFDEGCWREDYYATELRTDLDAIKPRINNWQDALIAEVALCGRYCLATADKNLAKVAARHGIRVYLVET